MQQQTFAVWRLDDNGNTFRVAAFQTQQQAEARIAELAAGGHKQTYWIESEQCEFDPTRRHDGP